MKKTLLVLALILCFSGLGFSQTLVNSNSVLVWDANTDDTTEYLVYYSQTSGSYNYETPVGTVTHPAVEYTISAGNPTEGQTYYAVVRARDAAGNMSASSSEVSFTFDGTAPSIPGNVRIEIRIVIQP